MKQTGKNKTDRERERDRHDKTRTEKTDRERQTDRHGQQSRKNANDGKIDREEGRQVCRRRHIGRR